MKKMSRGEILSWLEGIFEVAPGSLDPGTNRDQIEGWDSIGTLSLMADLDENLGIRPMEEELDALATVNDIIGLLQRNDCLE